MKPTVSIGTQDFEFPSKQRAGEDLHLELLHHGTWYRLQEKEGAEEPKPSEREGLPQSAEQYYALELGDFFGVIPGYYRLCMVVEETEEVEYLETYFWIK